MNQQRVTYVSEALAGYFAELDSLGLAVNTVKNRKGYLNRFGRVCEEIAAERGKRSGMTVEEIDRQVVSHYFSLSTGKQGNINNLLNALRGFFQYCEECGWLEQGGTKRLLGNRKTKKAVREPKAYIPAEDLPELLEAPCLTHPSQRMAMALFLYTLARRDEVRSILLKDVNLAEAIITIRRHKRKRWTDVGICPELHDELHDWLARYGMAYGTTAYGLLEAHPDWHLIPSLKWMQVRDERGRITSNIGLAEMDPERSPVHFERIVKRCLTHIGIQGTRSTGQTDHISEGCHTIRRSGARALLKHLSGVVGHADALTQVMKMLDHDDMKQTLEYIGMDQQRDELNNWLRGNSMYGVKPIRKAANVVALTRRKAV